MHENKTSLIPSINIYFGKKDADLCQWVHTVPRGLFSYIVREAIKNHLKGEKEYHLPAFDKDKKKTNTVTKALSLSYDTPDDKLVYDYIFSLDDHMRSYEIKQILREYMHSGAAPKSSNLSTEQAPAKKKTKKITVPPVESDKPAILPETPKKKENDIIANLVMASRKRSRKN